MNILIVASEGPPKIPWNESYGTVRSYDEAYMFTKQGCSFHFGSRNLQGRVSLGSRCQFLEGGLGLQVFFLQKLEILLHIEELVCRKSVGKSICRIYSFYCVLVDDGYAY